MLTNEALRSTGTGPSAQADEVIHEKDIPTPSGSWKNIGRRSKGDQPSVPSLYGDYHLQPVRAPKSRRIVRNDGEVVASGMR
jgi:hypothetical protein